MSIFVDPNARFELSFYYREIRENGRVVGRFILQDEDAEKVEVNELGEPIDETIRVFKGQFRPLSHKEGQVIRQRASAINHRDDKAILNLITYRPILLAAVCTSWNQVEEDEDGNPILDKNEQPKPLSISPSVIEAMQEHVIVYIHELWKRKIGVKI